MGWHDYKEERAEEREQGHLGAIEEFQEAAKLASQHGIILREVQCGIQYQLSLSGRKWLLNFYPGNGRLYSDKNRPFAPFLRVPPLPSLTDVVKAAIEQWPCVKHAE